MKLKSSRRTSVILSVLACLLLAPSDVEGLIVTPPIIWHVTPNGVGNCSDWANACDLQYALINSTAGYEIWVAEGIYKPADEGQREVTFWPKVGVELYGGFAGTETNRDERDWENNITVLSGDIDNDDITDDNGVITDTGKINGYNSFHVVTGSYTDSSTILDGFTITGGNANGSDPHDVGGGMQNVDGSPTLRNITFSGNSAKTGGGMYNTNSSPTLISVNFNDNSASHGGGGMRNGKFSNPTLVNVTFNHNSAVNNIYEPAFGGGMTNAGNPTLTNVTFSDNYASSGGGGMFSYQGSPTLTDVTFSGNSTSSGGGGMSNWESNPILTNVTFSNNSATFGGGMYNDNSSPTLSNVTFSGNKANEHGGGMYNTNSSSPTLSNVTFGGNSASVDGGGMHNWKSSPTLVNVAFSGNSATFGGGMYNTISCNPDMTNVTFSGNSAFQGGGMYNCGSPTLTNSILWGNTAFSYEGHQIYNYGSSSATVTYSDIQGGWDGDTNINQDPQFVDADGPDNMLGTLDDNLRLRLTSPAIDAGDNTAVPDDVTTDLDGLPRFVDIPFIPDTGLELAPPGPMVDMGAYEVQLPPTIYLPLVMESY